jgi:hypothetical protein
MSQERKVHDKGWRRVNPGGDFKMLFEIDVIVDGKEHSENEQVIQNDAFYEFLVDDKFDWLGHYSLCGNYLAALKKSPAALNASL